MTGFVRTMVQRWYLTLAGLLLTATLCVVASTVIKPTYEATASVLLLPPATSVGVGGNPYLQLGGLTQVVDVLARALATREMGNTVTAQDSRAEYTAAADVTTRGPILLLTATAPTAASSLTVLDTLLRQAPATLAGLQSDLNIAARSQITSMVLIRDADPTPIQKTRVRVLVALAAFGIVLTVLGVALLDALLSRRLTGRRRLTVAEDEDSSSLETSDLSAGSFLPLGVEDGRPDPAPTHDTASPTSRRTPRMRPAGTQESGLLPGGSVGSTNNGHEAAIDAVDSPERGRPAPIAAQSWKAPSGERSNLRLR